MLRYLCLMALAGWFIPASHTQPAPARWLTNLEEARQLARKEHKQILLNFSGSDWCGPCIMLRKEVFDAPSFQTFADSTLVLVNADFPRTRKNQLSKAQQENNDRLADRYNAQGKFPMTLLLDAEGNILKQWEGYPGWKPAAFTAEVKAVIDRDRAR